MKPSSLQVVTFLSTTAIATVIVSLIESRRRSRRRRRDGSGYEALIGHTPLIKLHRLSSLVKRSIYVKVESLNPGGTGKDRAALCMIQHAERRGLLPPPLDRFVQPSPKSPTASTTTADAGAKDLSLEQSLHLAQKASRTGGLVVEGTSGSTGISLATLSAARGHACLVVLPDDQAAEKQRILRTLGAIVHVVPNCAISNPNHYVNIARRVAEMANQETNLHLQAVFINQFENEANFDIHYTMTGPEILQGCPRIDGFVMSAGTGGTIAGVGKYLKDHRPKVQVVLVDPPGSALYHRIKHGIAYAPQQRERALKRHRYDTLAEGIGLDRMTNNFSLGVDYIDDAIRVSDQEAVDMAHFLLQTEGLWVGSSSAMNVVGAVRTALHMPPSSNVVTVLCDTGQRHVTRFWNADFIREWGLEWPGDGGERRIPECLKQVIPEGF